MPSFETIPVYFREFKYIAPAAIRIERWIPPWKYGNVCASKQTKRCTNERKLTRQAQAEIKKEYFMSHRNLRKWWGMKNEDMLRPMKRMSFLLRTRKKGICFPWNVPFK